MGADSTAVVLCPGGGHIQRLLPLIAGLRRRDLVVHVMTRAEARRQAEQAGGIFFDLFERFPLDAVDRESIPLPSRLVTFAGTYAEALIAEVAARRPRILIYDSFAVEAPLIARRLGIPYVGMRAGHAQVPAQAIAETRHDPRVKISAACLEAVDKLRTVYGMVDASPFSYLDGMSPYLNLYPEPPNFLSNVDRRAFEPIAFFGSLAPDLRAAMSNARPLAGTAGRLRVYVSFGSVIWRYYADAARAAMAQLTEVLATYDAEVLVGLGNHALDDSARRRIEVGWARVETYVDQWGALKDADLFVTHHGLNSTHEGLFHQVPMLSYPFFGDQPSMARCCQELGVAVALTDVPRAPLETAAVQRAIDTVMTNRPAFAARLAEARRWELDVIAGREVVLDRVLSLA